MGQEEAGKTKRAGPGIGLLAVCALAYWCCEAGAEPAFDARSGLCPALGCTAQRCYKYAVINHYPHDETAFTQGLVFEGGFLYEGTGLYGHSTLRKAELESGAVVQMLALPADVFGEGITIFGDRIIQLTWSSRVGYVYDKASFKLLRQFSYPTEGWGLTHDGERLIMSDGTSMLYFLDPETFEEVRRLEVYDADGPVEMINELEYVEGQIYANIWLAERIAMICPRTGLVTGWIDITGLGPCINDVVPNGIAYDCEGRRLFVTGKLWPEVFEIELRLQSPGDFDCDGRVDMADFAVLGAAWLTSSGEPAWNPACDISRLPDNSIDGMDLAVFSEHWLAHLGSDMQFIPSGEFLMGDSFAEGDYPERPVHAVYVDSFYMSLWEITNRQYCDYLACELASGRIKVVNGIVYGADDSDRDYPYCDTSSYHPFSQIAFSDGVFSVRTKGGRDMSDDPMVCVSWYGAATYCNWRSRQEGYEERYALTSWDCDFGKQGYRLATEAEWEYAARGGLEGKRFPWGNTISHTQANYFSSPSYAYDVSATRGRHPAYNSGANPYTAPVGSFPPNGYGLYDMAGNAWEWCNDRFSYSSNYYSISPYDNPKGPADGPSRCLRGGSWLDTAPRCRVAMRFQEGPESREEYGGFRIVLDLE